MAQILIRNIENNVVEGLKKRAVQSGRSLQGEIKLILEQTASVNTSSALDLTRRIRKKFKGRTLTDSVDLLREDRYS